MPKREIIIPVGPSPAYVPLTRGQFALIDSEDIENLREYSWYCSKNGYAVRKSAGGILAMHRQLLGLVTTFEYTDHRNGNRLDNRRANIRQCVPAENSRNIGKTVRNKSGFKGVSWNSTRGHWIAGIEILNRYKYLGRFDTPEAAYEAYCEAAKLKHGEFANHG